MTWLSMATWSVIADLFTPIREAFLSALVYNFPAHVVADPDVEAMGRGSQVQKALRPRESRRLRRRGGSYGEWCPLSHWERSGEGAQPLPRNYFDFWVENGAFWCILAAICTLLCFTHPPHIPLSLCPSQFFGLEWKMVRIGAFWVLFLQTAEI